MLPAVTQRRHHEPSFMSTPTLVTQVEVGARTAEFSDEHVTHVGGKKWSVRGSVDSENAFGAPIRNKYVCGVTYLGNDRWRLDGMGGLSN